MPAIVTFYAMEHRRTKMVPVINYSSDKFSSCNSIFVQVYKTKKASCHVEKITLRIPEIPSIHFKQER